MTDLSQLEHVTRELLIAYDVAAPPTPIEQILQNPLNGMWDDIDITQISTSFIQVGSNYSPRMSMARVLARHISQSDWGHQRGVDETLPETRLLAFARMLVMPAYLIMELDANARNAELLSTYFEIPYDDARIRLEELASYTG